MAEDRSAYEGLRDMALHAGQVREMRGPIAAIVIDVPAEGGYATIAGFADGTTSLYASTGGGTIGAGNYRPVAEATRQLLNTVAAHINAFTETDSGAWPQSGSVRFHLVAAAGNRFLDVPESSSWGRETRVVMPIIEAAHAVVAGIRMVQDAQSSLPNGVTRLMAAAQQSDIASSNTSSTMGHDLKRRTLRDTPH